MFESEGYLKAVEFLSNLPEEFKNEKKIQDRISFYNSYEPVPLTSMEPFYAEHEYWSEKYQNYASDKDNEGNERKDVIFGTWKNTYEIDGKYKWMRGVLYYRYEYKHLTEKKAFETTATLSVYNDKRLIGTCSISPGEHPVEFNFDVTNVDTLVIDFFGSTYSLDGSFTFAALSDVNLGK